MTPSAGGYRDQADDKLLAPQTVIPRSQTLEKCDALMISESCFAIEMHIAVAQWQWL